jgi:type II secretory pathway component GspD/PulD (secretin)
VLVRPETIATALNGLTIYGVVGDAVEYYVRALESTNKFKIISRPVVYTANNKKAKIATGQRIPVPLNTLSTAGSTVNTASIQSTIAFQDVLLKLEVIPLINANGDVSLKIAQTNDSVVGSQTISGNSIPIIGTQELNTSITVKNGQTIVLGGLVSEQKTRDARGIPLLSRIPGLGYLFSTTEKKFNRQELLIFIQPVVVDDIESAKIQSELERKRTEIEPNFDPVSPDAPPPKKEKKGILSAPINKSFDAPY